MGAMNSAFGLWSFPQVIGGFILIILVIAMWMVHRGGFEEGYDAGFEAGRRAAKNTKEPTTDPQED